MAPGSQKGLQVVVEDAEKLRDELRSRGVDASDVDKQPWGWFTYFSDPDGNTLGCPADGAADLGSQAPARTATVARSGWSCGYIT